ncbi:BLUF domain-containing protein [Azospirillum sp. sgz301742]
MHLSRLVYFSRAASLGHDDIEDILTKSYTNNYLKNVTGALFFNGHWFVQVLEGGQRTLSELFVRIAADERHKEVCLLEFSLISERLFPDWDMRYIGGHPDQEAIIKRFMPEGFDPLTVTDGATMARILKALADAGAEQPERTPRATPPA